MSTAVFNLYSTSTSTTTTTEIEVPATATATISNKDVINHQEDIGSVSASVTKSPRSTATGGAVAASPTTILSESLIMPSMVEYTDNNSMGATPASTSVVTSTDGGMQAHQTSNNDNDNNNLSAGAINIAGGTTTSTTTSSAVTPSSSSAQNSTFDMSAANTISTNNTLNSLSNHNCLPNINLDSNSNDNSIPDGYSVHIKASTNSNNNNGNNSSNQMMKQSSVISSSSGSSSPTPSAAPVSTTSSSSSSFNPSLPNLTSSESLSTFNIFEGLNNFPLIGTTTTSGGSSVSTSSFANALFNTNPLPTPPAPPSIANNVSGCGNNMTMGTMNTSSNIVTDETVAQIVSNTSVPEFLYQLTKMLTDDHRDIIEWSSGKIEVHNPTKLEKEVLNQYFRHSKYASFQRQLNYFGFRKLAGKGKMAPCSYVNENATSDLRSLLRMKRKTSANTKDGKSNSTEGDSSTAQGTKGSHGRSNKKSTSNKRARTSHRQPQHQPRHPHLDDVRSSSSITIAKGSGVKHQLNGYLAGNSSSNSAATTTALNYNTNGSILSSTASSSQITKINNPLVPDPMTSLDPLSIAKSAVGKGVTHQYSSSSGNNNLKTVSNTSTTGATSSTNSGIGIGQSIISGIPTDSCNKLTFLEPSQLGMGLESCLSELQTNFQNSLNEANANNYSSDGTNNMNNGNNNISSSNNNFNNNNNGNIAMNNNNNNNNMSSQFTNTQHQPQPTMQRESSLVDLAIIPSLSSTFPQSAGNMSLDNNLTSNSKSLENDYGMTFIDFPIAGLPPAEE